jgi:hypothetical protein
MRVIATLGNEHKVVAIGTYCDNLPLIATNVVVAIDPNPCSGTIFAPIFPGDNCFPTCFAMAEIFRDWKPTTPATEHTNVPGNTTHIAYGWCYTSMMACRLHLVGNPKRKV